MKKYVNVTEMLQKNKITTKKKLGIWMDHSHARLIEFNADVTQTKVVTSGFNHEEKVQSIRKSENLMHNKEQHEQAEYYKTLGEVIKKYDEVIIFGPTEAKQELFNTLMEDHHFEKIKIETKQTDKMTENQQQAFVSGHFLR